MYRGDAMAVKIPTAKFLFRFMWPQCLQPHKIEFCINYACPFRKAAYFYKCIFQISNQYFHSVSFCHKYSMLKTSTPFKLWILLSVGKGEAWWQLWLGLHRSTNTAALCIIFIVIVVKINCDFNLQRHSLFCAFYFKAERRTKQKKKINTPYLSAPVVLFFHGIFFPEQEYLMGFDLKALNMYKQCMETHA